MAVVGCQRSDEDRWVTTTTIIVLFCVSLITAGLPSARAAEPKKLNLSLTEGSELFDLWKSGSTQSLLKFYFFNITNPHEVEMGLKPKVTEVGPYAYRVYRQKENVTFLEEGSKVAAVTPETFVFVSEESEGDPNVDLITTVNIPVMDAIMEAHNLFFRTQLMEQLIGTLKLGILSTQTVSELLWGYEHPLLKRLQTLMSKWNINENFGLMLDRNGSHSGEYVYLTGESNYRDFGRIDTWNGQREMCWLLKQSTTINGTDGRIFHPKLTKEERLHVFDPTMQRSIYLEFEKVENVRGIPVYRFTLPRSALAGTKVNPEHYGVCKPHKECLGSGVLRPHWEMGDNGGVPWCYNTNAPHVVSLPHFYLADDVYSAAIDGLSPSKDLHQMYVDVNPATGVVVRASRTLQRNIILQRMPGIRITYNLKLTVVPIMYYKEMEEIDNVTETKLKQLLQTTQ